MVVKWFLFISAKFLDGKLRKSNFESLFHQIPSSKNKSFDVSTTQLLTTMDPDCFLSQTTYMNMLVITIFLILVKDTNNHSMFPIRN